MAVTSGTTSNVMRSAPARSPLASTIDGTRTARTRNMCSVIAVSSRLRGHEAGGSSWPADSSLAPNRFEQDPGPARGIDRVIPDPLNLRARDLPRNASEQERKLGREENQPGLTREVDGLFPIHALDVRHVAYDPVEMTDPAKQEAVGAGRVQVDDGQLARATHREEVDIAARIAWNIRVDRSEAVLERAGKLHEHDGQPVPGDRGGSQKRHASPGSGRGRRPFLL